MCHCLEICKWPKIIDNGLWGYRAVEIIVNHTASQNEHAISLLLPVNRVVRKST
jgi:hypothetical protein